MDALILSVGTGGGHNAAGYAVKEEMISRGHNAVMINPYDLMGGKKSKIIDCTYIKLVQIAPRAFGFIYRLGDAYRHLPWRSPVYFANKKSSEVLKKYLDNNDYDIIIATHTFPGEMISNITNRGGSLPKTIFISTDYTCSPFSEEAICDAYIIPAETLRPEYESYGIPRDKTHAVGIPTASAYHKYIHKNEAKAELGLDVNKKYLLVAGGSMGSGKLVKTIEHISEWCEANDNDCIPIVICGSNKKLLNSIRKKFGSRIISVGFTDRMPLYMKASEVFFTKPGGLSSTEAAAAGIPIVHITPIPGCENKNMNYYLNNGMSITAKASEKSIFTALDYLEIPENRDIMIDNQHRIINAYAARDICSIAELMTGKCGVKEPVAV